MKKLIEHPRFYWGYDRLWWDMLCCYSVWTWVNYPARMGLSPPFDRDGKVICSQQYDLDILGVVEKWDISYSPKMIHSGNVMDKMMMNQKKNVGTPIVVQAHCLLGGVMKNGIIHHHFRRSPTKKIQPQSWAWHLTKHPGRKMRRLTLAYTSYLSTTVLTGVPKSLASGHWLRCMLPTKASSWKGIMWQTGKKKTQAVEIYEEPWQKLVCQDTEEGQHDSNPGRIVKQAAHIHKALTGVFTRSSHPIW